MAPDPEQGGEQVIDPGLLKLDPYSYLDLPDEELIEDDAPAPEPDNPEARDVDLPPNAARAKAERLAAADRAACERPPHPPGRAAQPCPLKAREWLAVKVIGTDDGPVADVPVRLAHGEGVIDARTRADGAVLFAGLEKGEYTVTLPDHDRSAWALDSSGPPDETPPTPGGPATFADAPPPSTPAEQPHTAGAGESVVSIAATYGWLPDALWDHERNAELKERRGQGRTLVEGDRVIIPARTLGSVAAETGQQYVLRMKAIPAKLNLRLLAEGKPRKNEPYLLVVDGETRTGTTDGDGNVSVPVPPGAREGRLEVGPSGSSDVFELRLGHLQPADTLRGAQQRLANLGLLRAPFEADLGPRTAEALRDFQKARELAETGRLDDDTKAALRAAHGEH